jgi:hypothetical protein
MIGQQGIEVCVAGLIPAVCLLNVFPGPGTRNNQNGSIDV